MADDALDRAIQLERYAREKKRRDDEDRSLLMSLGVRDLGRTRRKPENTPPSLPAIARRLEQEDRWDRYIYVIDMPHSAARGLLIEEVDIEVQKEKKGRFTSDLVPVAGWRAWAADHPPVRCVRLKCRLHDSDSGPFNVYVTSQGDLFEDSSHASDEELLVGAAALLA